METKVEVTSLTHEELSVFFSVAFYHNPDFRVTYRVNDYRKIPEDKLHIPDDRRVCLEDKLADLVLNGYAIYVEDTNAGGESYGNLPSRIIKNDDDDDWESVEYTVTYDDILKGVGKEGADSIHGFKEVLSGEGDIYDATYILQLILFGEEIY